MTTQITTHSPCTPLALRRRHGARFAFVLLGACAVIGSTGCGTPATCGPAVQRSIVLPFAADAGGTTAPTGFGATCSPACPSTRDSQSIFSCRPGSTDAGADGVICVYGPACLG